MFLMQSCYVIVMALWLLLWCWYGVVMCWRCCWCCQGHALPYFSPLFRFALSCRRVVVVKCARRGATMRCMMNRVRLVAAMWSPCTPLVHGRGHHHHIPTPPTTSPRHHHILSPSRPLTSLHVPSPPGAGGQRQCGQVARGHLAAHHAARGGDAALV